MNLLNLRWYRNLFNNRTFVKLESGWIDIKKYQGGKITDVDGKWNTQAFCDCGNELVHSKSFVQQRITEAHTVLDYKCSHCGKEQHWNSGLIPGLIRCEFDGTPIGTTTIDVYD